MIIRSSKIKFSDTNFFSNIVVDYLNHDDALKPFISDFPSNESLKNKITQKVFTHRKVLVDRLNVQYQNVNLHGSVTSNIELLLQENTFTICTAHQPNIFTGYLYFIYKIMHAIKLAIKCKVLFPLQNFVPVYYIGSEDNDLEEIGILNYNDTHYTWETKQTGACGSMSTNDLIGIRDEIIKTLNPNVADEAMMIEMLSLAYDGNNSLAQATRILVNELFGKYGLLIIDGNDVILKSIFVPIMEDELFQQSSEKIVNQTTTHFPKKYKTQASPRDINLFYLIDNLRERIVRVGDVWKVLHSDIQFNEDSLKLELKNHPDRFSPNVILRPLYQESILPNIAFIGGGGELAYWIQLKNLFENFKLQFPILFLRNSIQWIDKHTIQKIEQLELSDQDIFLPKDILVKKLLTKSESLQELKTLQLELDDAYNGILQLSKTVSATLPQSVEAHRAKILRLENRIEQKFISHLKLSETLRIEKLASIQNRLFPSGGLQERHSNFLSIFKLFGFEMFNILFENQDSFEKEFMILKTL